MNIVMFAGRRNVQNGSARTQIWSMEQPNGIPSDDTTNLIEEVELSQPFDVIVVNDRHVKHRATEMKRLIENEEATRGVYVMFARRPELKPGSADSDPLDVCN